MISVFTLMNIFNDYDMIP